MRTTAGHRKYPTPPSSGQDGSAALCWAAVMAPATKRFPRLGRALLLLYLSLYVSAEAGVNITAAQDSVSHLTPTPDTPTASATLTPPTPNATTTPPAWRTPPATPTPTPAKPLARHQLPAGTKPRHGRRHELLQAAYKRAVVQQNKGPVPTPMTGAVMQQPAQEVAAGPNRASADPQPSKTTGATGITTTDATTPDISHAANKTLNDTVAATMTSNNTAASGTGTGTDLRYLYDASSAGAPAALTKEERKDEEVYQACTNNWNAVMRVALGARKLLSDGHLGCRVVTVSIRIVRRMLPGGGRSGGRKLLSLSSGAAYQLLSDFVYQLALQLNPYYRGGASGGRRRLLVVDGIPTALVTSHASCSIPNSTRLADASTAPTAAGVATPRVLPADGPCGHSCNRQEGKDVHPAGPHAANNTHNETSTAPAADVAAGHGPPANHTAASGTGTTTDLRYLYDASSAGAPTVLTKENCKDEEVLGRWKGAGRLLPGGGRSGGKHKRRLLSSSRMDSESVRRLLPGGGRRDTFSAPSGHRTAPSHSSRRPAVRRVPLPPPPVRGAQPQATGGKL